jgi:GT2 family glycosyltransferase
MVTNNRISITAPPGLVSIVIPSCGMLDYTKLCVPSLLRHSRTPFELIVLDIGSLDGTAEYLAGLRDGLHNRVRVEICRAATDLQIPEAVEDALPYRLGPRKGARPGEPLVDVSAVEAFARDHLGQMRGKWIEAEALGGFCLLIRRETLERIRPALAQWTDLSLFDTDIAGKKARQEGFKLVVCRDLFIHHFGTRTFAHGAPTAAEDNAAAQRFIH